MTKIALFIDTNIFLSFYKYGQASLDHLNKLHAELIENNVQLYITEQVMDEFQRQRQKILKETISSFEKIEFKKEYPTIIRNFENEYQELRKTQKAYEIAHANILKPVQQAAIANKLPVDVVIDSVFKKSTRFNRTPEIIDRASTRVKLGNPPGKKNCIRDAVNWEILLANVEKNVTTVIISQDGDYFDELAAGKLRPFLHDEWCANKNSVLYAYTDLNAFLIKHLPDLQFIESSYEDADKLIDELSLSANFSTTHKIISSLNSYLPIFTDGQINKIFDAYLNNNQVNWILTDQDVRGFIEEIFRAHPDLESNKQSDIKALMSKLEE